MIKVLNFIIKNTVFKVIKNIENNLKKLQGSVHNTIRNKSLSILNNLCCFNFKKGEGILSFLNCRI